ncbi:HlyD family secretion protein, partial [Bacteroidales bacterium OttesenSCG-928-L03]|nr:HlyD family secretion protein [Bacteroidales bacterium OttesenSCG-928-L03]
MILVIAGICFIPYIKTIAVPVTISISPTNTYSGLAFIPQKHSITVKKGARIKIELFDFPASEYGQIIGEISQLHLSNNVGIKADISLPHGLKTSKGYIIDHVPSLGGHAYITISKQPIFHNIIGDFDSK